MRYEVGEQVSMFDPDSWSGRTCQEPCQAQEKKTQAKTSKPSSRKSSESSNRAPLMCLCLRGGHGTNTDVSTAKWETGPLPIGCMMLNISGFRKDADGLLSSQISTDLQPRKFFLTLNCGEKPRVPNPTKLSEILEPKVSPKFNLSGTACRGILTRAERRGKDLPTALDEALSQQRRYLFKNEPVSQGGYWQ